MNILYWVMSLQHHKNLWHHGYGSWYGHRSVIWKPYLYLWNPWLWHRGVTHTCATPYFWYELADCLDRFFKVSRKHCSEQLPQRICDASGRLHGCKDIQWIWCRREWVYWLGDMQMTHIKVSAHLDCEMVLVQVEGPCPNYTADWYELTAHKNILVDACIRELSALDMVQDITTMLFHWECPIGPDRAHCSDSGGNVQ